MNFNSIKVRLELVGNKSIIEGVSVFQFHKGAIRTCHAVYVTEDKCYFNSIKVRLEPIPNLPGYWRCSFQFHKGAIRTPNCSPFHGTSCPISIP